MCGLRLKCILVTLLTWLGGKLPSHPLRLNLACGGVGEISDHSRSWRWNDLFISFRLLGLVYIARRTVNDSYCTIHDLPTMDDKGRKQRCVNPDC